MIWKFSILLIIRSGIFLDRFLLFVCLFFAFFLFFFCLNLSVWSVWWIRSPSQLMHILTNNWHGAHNCSQPELDMKYFPCEMYLPWLNSQCENNCFPFLQIEFFFRDENNNQHLPGGTIPILWNWNLKQLTSAQVFKCVLPWCFGEQQNLG